MTPFDCDLWNQVVEALSPPARVSPVEWAQANMTLPASSNAEPGKLTFTPYQKGLLEAWADPASEIIVLMLASQTGKSLTADAAILSTMAVDPGPMLIVHPTDSKAKQYAQMRLDPLIRATPAVRSLIQTNSLTVKTFAGGSLRVASSYKSDDLAASACRYVILDEVDRFASSANGEGDPVTLAIKRSRTFRDRKILIMSTPTSKGASRIADWFDRGSQERFFTPCPECGSFQVFTFDQLKWTPGKPETAHLQCEHCAHHITERERLRAVDQGHWEATGLNPEKGIRSFHASELVSKFSSLESVASQAESADSEDKKRVFVNTTLGEPYDSGTDATNDPSELEARAVPILSPYPAEIEFVTCGADVQANRIEALFLGHGKDGRKWIIDRQVIAGDVTSPVPWQGLAQAVRSTFRMRDGRELPLSATFVDSGFMSSSVYQFVGANPRCYAVKGASGFDKPAITPGRKHIAGPGQRLLMLGVDSVKLGVAKALKIAQPGPNFMALPAHLDSTFFEQLAAERLTTKHVRGFPRQQWEKEEGVRNEAFDCLVYAYAAGFLIKKPAKPINADQRSNVVHLFGERARQLSAAVNGGKN